MDVPPGRRKRLKKQKPLTVSEKVEIVHKVLVQHEKVLEVAREHRRGVGVVQSLVTKARNNPALLSELMASRDSKEQTR